MVAQVLQRSLACISDISYKPTNRDRRSKDTQERSQTSTRLVSILVEGPSKGDGRCQAYGVEQLLLDVPVTMA